MTTILARAGAVAVVVAFTGIGAAGVGHAEPLPEPTAEPVAVVEPTPTPAPSPEPTPAPTPTPEPTPVPDALPLAAENEQRTAAADDSDAVRSLQAAGPVVASPDLGFNLPPVYQRQLGALTLTPATGTDTTTLTATAAAACPASSDQFGIELVRGSRTGDATSGRNTVEAATMSPDAAIGASATAAISVEIEATLAETSAFLVRSDAEPLSAGIHGIALLCMDSEATRPSPNQPFVDGVFIAPLYLTSATAFRTMPPAGTPTPTPSSTPSPSPAVVAAVNSSGNSAAGGSTASGSTGSLAFTGAPVALLGMVGSALAALGAALVLAGRRATRPAR